MFSIQEIRAQGGQYLTQATEAVSKQWNRLPPTGQKVAMVAGVILAVALVGAIVVRTCSALFGRAKVGKPLSAAELQAQQAQQLAQKQAEWEGIVALAKKGDKEAYAKVSAKNQEAPLPDWQNIRKAHQNACKRNAKKAKSAE